MTASEITALRKSGHLQEALDAAETEFATSQNTYIASALFWCLNELCKSQFGDELGATYERMKSLNEDYCTGDTFQQRALESVEKRILPHAEEIRRCLDEAKAGGNAIASANAFANYYDSNDLDAKLFADYGWLIYYALKQTVLTDAHNRKLWLFRYLKLDLEKPSLLHSLILGEAVKVEKNTPLQFRIRDFVKMWGLENLREEDWEQFKTEDGKLLPSLVEKLIGVYAKELKTDGVPSYDEFSDLVDKALNTFDNNQYLPYYKAVVLISRGDTGEAIKYYKELVLKNPSKFYLWEQLAGLVDDNKIQIGLLCKAVNCGVDEEFIGGVRLKLASKLAEIGLYANAKTELDKYRRTYELKNWGLKQEFHEISRQLPKDVCETNNASLYAEYSAFAEQFIYSELPSIYVVKVADKMIDDKHRPGKKYMSWVLKGQRQNWNLKKPQKFGFSPKTPNGVLLEVKVFDNKIVWMRKPENAPHLAWIKTTSGKVTIRKDKKGHDFATIEGIYVGANLLKGIANGQDVTVMALRNDEGRWIATSIK